MDGDMRTILYDVGYRPVLNNNDPTWAIQKWDKPK